jgi:hypothetical protein
LYRHVRLATCTTIAAFIGVIGIGGLVLLYQAVGRSLPTHSKVPLQANSTAVERRAQAPAREETKVEPEVPTAFAATTPSPPTDSGAQSVNRSVRTASSSSTDNGSETINEGERAVPSPPDRPLRPLRQHCSPTNVQSSRCRQQPTAVDPNKP